MSGTSLPACISGPDAPQEAREPESAGIAWGERHLQCIWADERLRPRLCTTGGLPVEVADPGKWNGGPGPDFLDALVEIAGERRRGDVEIHVRPGDWEAHGHSDDPAYRDVVLHVTWFPPRPGNVLPEIPLAILRDAMLERPGFSFDQIDPDSYPWGGDSAARRPCRDAFAGASPETIRAVLAAAGRARAVRKSREAANRAVLAPSEDQAFYEETMAALGWRANEGPMRRLAREVPVAELAARKSDAERWALLLGRAGLLPREPGPSAPPDWFAGVWDAAFRAGATDAADGLRGWKLGGVRPANHPRVRLAAAAAMFRDAGALRRALAAIPRDEPKAWAKAARETILAAAAPGAALLPRPAGRAAPARPLGAARADALLANAVVPALMRDDPAAVELLDAIPGEDVGAAMKEAAHRLFGPDHNPTLLYASGALRTQGLLELWRGRCRAAPETCAGCPLAR